MSSATLDTREMSELNDTVVVVAPIKDVDTPTTAKPSFKVASAIAQDDFVTAFAEFIGKD